MKSEIKGRYGTEKIHLEIISVQEVNEGKEASEVVEYAISRFNKQIIDMEKPFEFWISCNAVNKKKAKTLKHSLASKNGLSVSRHFIVEGFWSVSGMKIILFNQLNTELNHVRKTANFQNSRVFDWYLKQIN